MILFSLEVKDSKFVGGIYSYIYFVNVIIIYASNSIIYF